MSLTPPAAPDSSQSELAEPPPPSTLLLSSLLRIAVFLAGTLGFWWLFANLISPFAGGLVTSIFSLGFAVLISTAGMMRMYERRPFYAVGLFPNRAGLTHFLFGVALGAGASLLVLALQCVFGWARLERVPRAPGGVLTIVFWFVLLFAGATGEELLFRGYGFQNLIRIFDSAPELALDVLFQQPGRSRVTRSFGPWLAIVTTSMLFGLGHTANPAFSRVAMVNTILFG